MRMRCRRGTSRDTMMGLDMVDSRRRPMGSRRVLMASSSRVRMGRDRAGMEVVLGMEVSSRVGTEVSHSMDKVVAVVGWDILGLDIREADMAASKDLTDSTRSRNGMDGLLKGVGKDGLGKRVSDTRGLSYDTNRQR